MGYLIKNALEKISVIVPAGSLANVDTVPYQIIKSNALTNYTIVAANLICADTSTGDVNSFGHFYLQFGYSTGIPQIAIYDESISAISTSKSANFIINMSHPPNRFGSINQFTSDLTLSSELAPVTNTDLVVTIYYFRNF
jgi:hypothetical protein